MADNNALLEKFQAIIKAEVSAITKNSDTNTGEIKRSITDIKKDISPNADKIKEVNTRVDEVTDELKEMKRKINDLALNFLQFICYLVYTCVNFFYFICI